MKRLLVGLGAVSLLAGASAAAEAVPLYVNFCPGDPTCPTGVTEASLLFDEYVDPSDPTDPNDYTLTVTISGDATAPYYVDELSFSISGVQTPGGYEGGVVPTLLSSPSVGSPWTVFFDNVTGSPVNNCGQAPLAAQEVCTQSTGNGAILQSQTLVWTYLVDLDTAVLGAGSLVNLRAQFLNFDGSNAGILSPGDGGLTVIPEPTTLVLFGSGLLIAGRMRRWRRR